MKDSDDSSDSDDSDDTSRRIYSRQSYRSKSSISHTPRASVRELNTCATQILDKISEVNSQHAEQGKQYDCVAVGYATNGELIISGNVKQRFVHPITHPKRGGIRYGEMGFNDRLINPITQALTEQLNKNGDFKVHIIQQQHNQNEVPTPATNARDHAEMQILAYAQLHDMEIDKIGRQQVRVKFDTYHHNIPETRREARNIISNNVVQQVIPKPTYTITAASVLDIIEDIDKDPCAQASSFNTYAGKYKKPRTGRFEYCAGASVAEANASAGIFGASASMLSASAHAEGGTNWSVGANASVARAEAHAGPVQIGVGLNFNTGVSAGVDGLHASFLGMGIDIGPKLSIQTPIVDASCNIS
ncbi:unnamed protein product [Rotaria socialis]|uniref:Uncharacterized protein n=1 Tax=Rotaria socialis TaxID=392032 RepID=A0A821PHJ7_9BILA|nr:unnamed protein product [Rotaria socialis]CAF4804758.1 unnamed protein product [Rotaria socialis]